MAEIATLFEYEPVDYKEEKEDKVRRENNKVIITLSKKTINELEKLNKTKKFLEIGRNTIKPLNYVGVVKVGGITFEILPKFISENKKDLIAKNLLKMLEFTNTLNIKEVDYADLFKEKHRFFEIFVTIFSKNLLNLLKRNQYMEYIRKREETRFVKGKIDFSIYFNPARLHIIPCEYYDRTIDNTINRTLKYVCFLMSKIVESRENYRRLRQIMDIFEHVKLEPITVEQIRNITFNRLNEDFKPFIDICKIFLENSTLTLQASRFETFSLLIPMERLFEQFIAEVIKREKLHEKVFGSDRDPNIQETYGYLLYKNGDRMAKLKPDIVIEAGDDKVIIDTKYKLLDPEDRKLGVSQQDLYQIYTYCKEIKANKAILLYPDWLNKFNEEHLKKPFKIGANKDITLFVRTVSLDVDLTEKFEEFVKRLEYRLSDYSAYI